MWKPLFAFCTYREILSTDTNLPKIFLGNYHDLLFRIQKLSNLIDLPNSEEIEIDLLIPVDQLRTKEKGEIIENMRGWWLNFLKELRNYSNNRLRNYWDFEELNNKQWTKLREEMNEKYIVYRQAYSDQSAGIKARNYQNVILNRESFLKKLTNEIFSYLELELQKVEGVEPSLIETRTNGIQIIKPEEPKLPDFVTGPLDEWLLNLSPHDRSFLDLILNKFNKGEKVAIYELGTKNSIPRQKIEYLCSFLTEFLPAIQHLESKQYNEY